MQVLREISAQSVDSTSATSQSIAKLADLSAGLRKSITGFRLPGSTENAGAQRDAAAAARSDGGTAAGLGHTSEPATPEDNTAASGSFSRAKALGGS